jgi:crossover junction endodeoxyribonuclease RusA
MIVTLPYPPSANRYLRHTARGTYRTKVANEYRTAAGWLAKAAGARPTSCPVEMVVTLHPRMTAKGKASGICLDLDNCIKVAMDALQGVAFENDKQVKKITMAYGEPMVDGGLTLQVTAL